MSKNKKLSCVELFSGPGGLGLGFHLANFKTLIAYEFEEDCINTYKANFPDTFVIQKDLSSFSDDDIVELKKHVKKQTKKETVDIVMGGPPCRSFSTSNPKKKYGDKRDYLYKQLITVADKLGAQYFLMENVDDILSKGIGEDQKKKVFHCLLEDLYEAGFEYINFKVLKAADYGIPQTRERIFILASKNPNVPLCFPAPTHGQSNEFLHKWITVEDAFEDLPKVAAPRDEVHGEDQHLVMIRKGRGKSESYCNSYRDAPNNEFTQYCRGIPSKIYPFRPFSWINYNGELSLYLIPDHTQRIIKRYSLLKEDENQGDLVRRLKDELSSEEYHQLVQDKIIPEKIFIQKNRKLPSHLPARTVTSHAREELVHPYYNRNLTAREVARLQSFPDWFTFTGVNQRPFKPSADKDIGTGRDYYQQVGDAVPPLLAYAVAKELRKNLSCKLETNNASYRRVLIRKIFTENIKLQEVQGIFKISISELSDILSGTVMIQESLQRILEDHQIEAFSQAEKYADFEENELNVG